MKSLIRLLMISISIIVLIVLIKTLFDLLEIRRANNHIINYHMVRIEKILKGEEVE